MPPKIDKLVKPTPYTGKHWEASNAYYTLAYLKLYRTIHAKKSKAIFADIKNLCNKDSEIANLIHLKKQTVYYVNTNIVHSFLAIGTPGQPSASIYNFESAHLTVPFEVTEAYVAKIKNAYFGFIITDHIKLASQLKDAATLQLVGLLGKAITELENTSLGGKNYIDVLKSRIKTLNPTIDDVKLDSILNTKNASITIRQAIINLKGQSFYVAQHFLTAFEAEVRRLGNNVALGSFVTNQLRFVSTHPMFDARTLFNTFGPIILKSPPARLAEEDRKKFEENKDIQLLAYPNIEPEILREEVEQRRLYQNYMFDTAGIYPSEKVDVSVETTKRILAKMPRFVRVPDTIFGNNPLTANCGKGAASLLQRAEDRSAEKQKRAPQTVVAASICAVGSSNRMQMWSSLLPQWKKIVYDLLETINDREFETLEKEEDFVLTRITKTGHNLNYLADNKEEIYKQICELEEQDQMLALKQAIDPTSALGKVFYHKRFMTLSAPSIDHGYLLKIKNRLIALQHKAVAAPSSLVIQEVAASDAPKFKCEDSKPLPSFGV